MAEGGESQDAAEEEKDFGRHHANAVKGIRKEKSRLMPLEGELIGSDLTPFKYFF